MMAWESIKCITSSSRIPPEGEKSKESRGKTLYWVMSQLYDSVSKGAKILVNNTRSETITYEQTLLGRTQESGVKPQGNRFRCGFRNETLK